MSQQDVKKFVDDLISNKKVVVFSKRTCPYCLKAKKALSQYLNMNDNNVIVVIELDGDSRMSEIQSYLKRLTGYSTVPRVFINGQCIGGGDDTVRLHKTGELANLLQKS